MFSNDCLPRQAVIRLLFSVLEDDTARSSEGGILSSAYKSVFSCTGVLCR